MLQRDGNEPQLPTHHGATRIPAMWSIEPTGRGFPGRGPESSSACAKIGTRGEELRPKKKKLSSPSRKGVNPGAPKPRALNERELCRQPRQKRRHRGRRLFSRETEWIGKRSPRKEFPHLWCGEQKPRRRRDVPPTDRPERRAVTSRGKPVLGLRTEDGGRKGIAEEAVEAKRPRRSQEQVKSL